MGRTVPRGIDPPDPYRVLVRIPDGFEYTGPDQQAETAVSQGALAIVLTAADPNLSSGVLAKAAEGEPLFAQVRGFLGLDEAVVAPETGPTRAARFG